MASGNRLLRELAENGCEQCMKAVGMPHDTVADSMPNVQILNHGPDPAQERPAEPCGHMLTGGPGNRFDRIREEFSDLARVTKLPHLAAIPHANEP